MPEKNITPEQEETLRIIKAKTCELGDSTMQPNLGGHMINIPNSIINWKGKMTEDDLDNLKKIIKECSDIVVLPNTYLSFTVIFTVAKVIHPEDSSLEIGVKNLLIIANDNLPENIMISDLFEELCKSEKNIELAKKINEDIRNYDYYTY